VLALQIGCGPTADRDEAHDPFEVAFERGVEALVLRPSECTVGALWAVQQIPRLGQLPALRSYVEAALEHCARRPGAFLLDRDLSHHTLPRKPGKGLARLYSYVLAPMGKPKSRAARFLTDFVSTDETGYVLNHQLLTLVWAGQIGLELPMVPRTRQRELLERIAGEQARDPSFSDLFAERAAILLLYGLPDAQTAQAWIETIAARQTERGHWEDPRGFSIVSYDGVEGEVAHPVAHTTSLSLLALGVFLERR
jgi:hypothetical protein